MQRVQPACPSRFSSPPSFSCHPFSHHSPTVIPLCPWLRELHQLGLQVNWTNPLFPSTCFLLQSGKATLIRWCRFAGTEGPGEPLVSSLQFQNVLLNVRFYPPLSRLLQLPLSFHKLLCLWSQRSFTLNIWCTCLDNHKRGISKVCSTNGRRNQRSR